MEAIINTDEILFLVQFTGKGTNGKFITNSEGLADCVKAYNLYGIEFIKEFDRKNQKFVRLSKKQLRVWLNTEAILELEKIKYL